VIVVVVVANVHANYLAASKSSIFVSASIPDSGACYYAFFVFL